MQNKQVCGRKAASLAFQGGKPARPLRDGLRTDPEESPSYMSS